MQTTPHSQQSFELEHAQLPAVRAVFQTAELNSLIVESTRVFDLPSLARVSHVLSHHALRTLWRVLPSPLPLLKLFKKFNFFMDKWQLTAPVQDNEWASFDKYASLIHRFLSILSSVPSGPIDIDANIFLQLRASHPSKTPIFSHLRRFYMPGTSPSNRPFLSHALQDVRFDLTSSMDFYVDELLEYSPQVSTLCLSGYICPRSLSLLQSFSHIIDLRLLFCTIGRSSDEIQVMQVAFVTFIGSLHLQQHLTHLTLAIPLAFTCVLPKTSLPAVKVLQVRGRLSIIHQLICCTHDLELAALDLTDYDVPHHSSWLRCFEGLLQTSAGTLRTLVLGLWGHIQLGRIINPLLQIHGLRSFRIIHHHTSTLSVEDGDIRRIVDAWPSIEEFILPMPPYIHSYLTLRCLNAFAELSSLCLLRVIVCGHIVCIPRDPFSSNNGVVEAYVDRLFSQRQLNRVQG